MITLILLIIIELLLTIIIGLIAISAIIFYSLYWGIPFSFQFLKNERGIEINLGNTNSFDPIFPPGYLADNQFIEEVEAFNEEAEQENEDTEFTWNWDNQINWGAPAWELDTPENQGEDNNSLPDLETEPDFHWEPHTPDYRDPEWIDWAIQTIPFTQLRNLVYAIFRHDSINPQGYIIEETQERIERGLPRVQLTENTPAVVWEEPVHAFLQIIEEEEEDFD